MLLYQTIFSLLFLLLQQTPDLLLRQDMERDLRKLQNASAYISDNTTSDPSVDGVAQDLQLFQVVANIDLSGSDYSSTKSGSHTVHKWQFNNSDIKAIYQVESIVEMDSVVTQQYVDKRVPTQHRVTNSFVFRVYAVSTAASAMHLYYITEHEQGLLAYSIGEKQVEIGYGQKKEGISDLLPTYEQEVKRLLERE